MPSFNKTLFHSILVHLYFFFYLLISITQFPLASHCCHEEDRIALLKGSQHENCCNWHGIGCSNHSFRVVSIDLRNTALENYYIKKLEHYTSVASNPPNTSLTGKFSASLLRESRIPRQFSDLTTLTHLDLSYSYFSTSISTQFTNLSSLRYLDLSCKGDYYTTFCLQMSSTKWLRGLVNLHVLRMSGIDLYDATSLQKNFAEHISYLSNLRDLDLSSCNLSAQVFPIHEFLNLPQLSSLKMNRNPQLNSLFPIQLANLTSLSILELYDCKLYGSVPYLPQLKELRVSYNRDLRVDSMELFKHQWPKLQKLKISGNEVIGPILHLISNAPLLVSLYASSCSIQGSLPSSLYNLSQLQYLGLSFNSITGDIHSSVSNLKFLYHLDLINNNIQGIVPKSICEIFPLRHLYLGGNNITGAIPNCILMLPNLRVFSVPNNSIAGNVSLTKDLNITYLDLSLNKLTVVIDENLYLYPKLNLKTLGLGSCNLEEFPTFICNLTHLWELDLSYNNLTGAIPSCLFKLGYLRTIYLSNNKFHGALPLPPLGLYKLEVSNNKLSGEISTEIGKRLSNAFNINLSGNKLSGTIPFSMFPTKPQFLTDYIDLSNNKLSGIIPTNIGYCGSLRYLNLGTNNLTGKFPRVLELAKTLKYLQLSKNHLDGTINFISTLHKLEFLNLQYNNFGGSIPTGLGALQDIKYLSLRSNKLTGSIPEEILHLQKLQILDLALNNLSGSVPIKLGNWTGLMNNSYASDDYGDIQLQMVTKGIVIQVKKLFNYSTLIDLSCNCLNGSIPKEIGLLKVLASLNLSHNQLSDDIPVSVGDLSALGSLDLSANRLSGPIPHSLTSVHSLGVLNLSYNMLSGKIPRENHFDTLSLDGLAFAENDLLCGFPTEKICKGDRNTSTSNATDKDDEVDREDVKDKLLYAIVALGFGVGFCGLYFVLLMKKQKYWFRYWRFIDSIALRIAECIQNN
ncbi:hypothetical protein MKW92_020737 [Papaver armeniacum]|nr:hypothetical protein MKW92_020737 [Papaver armeniacum]